MTQHPVIHDTETQVHLVRNRRYLLGRRLTTQNGPVRKVYRVQQTLPNIAVVRTQAQAEDGMRYDASGAGLCTRCGISLKEHGNSTPTGRNGRLPRNLEGCKEFTTESLGAEQAGQSHGQA